MKPLLMIPLLVLSALPAEAGYSRPGYSNQCFEEVYREEYIPGTVNRPGRVRTWKDKVEVPCGSGNERVYEAPPPRPRFMPEPPPRRTAQEENSCVEGSILGGILGAAGGAAASRGDGRWIGVPIGIVTGSMIGCQIDGG